MHFAVARGYRVPPIVLQERKVNDRTPSAIYSKTECRCIFIYLYIHFRSRGRAETFSPRARAAFNARNYTHIQRVGRSERRYILDKMREKSRARRSNPNKLIRKWRAFIWHGKIRLYALARASSLSLFPSCSSAPRLALRIEFMRLRLRRL